jgi:hypothetical protein
MNPGSLMVSGFFYLRCKIVVSPLPTASCSRVKLGLALRHAKKEIYQATDVLPNPKVGERQHKPAGVFQGTRDQQKYIWLLAKEIPEGVWYQVQERKVHSGKCIRYG